ncbi:hypothetical protein [Frondihabitans australicus]|uniref:Large exoprotein n=1 Tax=Frondihabitans australicus TaxID=386892 RepID=A0A495IGL1_9MICO|nr:hypothetical protein [Frondihabitans australicus]RKR75127.1 hypothetical protein C8E83_2265 [Frondihabitans australicus]
MGISSWGGGIVLGLVAVLWLVYLIPSWAKRQQYLATERNAVRLQQTLRILAQTAELPEEIRVEANAKSVASAQKILRTEEAKREAIRRAQEAARQRAITRELAAAAPALAVAASAPALAARRLRRTRLVATLVLAVSIALVVVGALHFASSWLMVVAAAVAGVGSIAVLGQLAAVSRARARRAADTGSAARPSVAAAPVAQAFQDFAPSSTSSEVQDPGVSSADTDSSREWTPVPMPRPLYLRRGSARDFARSSAVAPTSSGDADALRAAAERSAEALRQAQERARLEAQRQALREVARAEAALDAQREAAVVEARGVSRDEKAVVGRVSHPAPAASAPAPVVTSPSPTSPFARMGYLDEGETQELRLDEILQRRRAV